MNSPICLPSSNLQPADLSGLKVLVVDDHANTLRLMSDVLRAGGVGDVFTAGDGLQARQQIQSRDPDIIFTDCRMPLMDGLDLTRSIRRSAVRPDPWIPNPEVPVIMVTSQRSVYDVNLARRAGVNEFVIKPFTPAALLSRIQLVLRRPRSFIVSEVYVGPDRRRKVELNYSGALKRASDPEALVDARGREETRETIAVELEAMSRLIHERGGVDRSTLQMIYRVMNHTTFRARQIRDKTIERASESMIAYVDAMGGPDACDPAVIEVHFNAIRNLLAVPQAGLARERVERHLETSVLRRSDRGLRMTG